MSKPIKGKGMKNLTDFFFDDIKMISVYSNSIGHI